MIQPLTTTVQGACTSEYLCVLSASVSPSPLVAIALAALIAPAAALRAQEPAASTPAGTPLALDSTRADSARRSRAGPRHYWKKFAAGFASSILAHEGAHVVTAYAVGGHPTIGIQQGTPDRLLGDLRSSCSRTSSSSSRAWASTSRRRWTRGSSTCRTVAAPRSSAGVLAGGIATALFYVTIGRTASVSDVDFMARTSSLSKTDITIIYGGVAALHALRIHRDERYADFFVRPDTSAGKGLRVGVDIQYATTRGRSVAPSLGPSAPCRPLETSDRAAARGRPRVGPRPTVAPPGPPLLTPARNSRVPSPLSDRPC